MVKTVEDDKTVEDSDKIGTMLPFDRIKVPGPRELSELLFGTIAVEGEIIDAIFGVASELEFITTKINITC